VSIHTGLIIAISSTEATYTADATSYDVFGEVEEWEPQNVDVLGTQVTGDLTTTLNTRTLWADGAGPHTIYKVVVNEKLGTKCFVIIQPWASNSIAPQFVIPLAASATLTLNFGVSGIVPIMFNRAISSAITTYNGGYIFLADGDANGNFAVPYTLSSNRGTIKAWWV
jgi:hypothetical protein